MKCPFCNNADTHVKDSRASDDNISIRRRRYCGVCKARFTTLETLHLKTLYVQKRDGVLQPFVQEKLKRSISVALTKRPVCPEEVDKVMSEILYRLEGIKNNVISSTLLGELVMAKLKTLDKVAHIRFASVYMNFEKAEDFIFTD